MGAARVADEGPASTAGAGGSDDIIDDFDFHEKSDGRSGSNGLSVAGWAEGRLFAGREMEEYSAGLIVPPPNHPCCGTSGEPIALDGGRGLAMDLSEAVGVLSCRLSLRASRRSTRSLHCFSMSRSDSCSERSVSVRGFQFEGSL